MQKRNWNKWKFMIAAVLLLTGFLTLSGPTSLQAADQPVSVTSCKLNSKGKKLTVKAKVKNKTKAMGSKLYLLGLNANVSETGKKSATPLASVKAKKGTVSFKINYKDSMLFQKFAVAYKTGKKYKITSNVRYITNPEALATYKGKGPTASSKKGIQTENLEDSLALGAQHAVVNWTLNSLLNNQAVNKTSFTYKNKKYYLDADQIQRNDEMVRAYRAAGVRVTVILLLPKDSGSKGTLPMQYGGHSYTLFSSFKTSSKAGCQTLEAVMTYLAKRYGTEENLVSGWIVGNEVNSAAIWNYGGNKSLSAYMDNYARAFRICSNAVKSVNKNANVYISLDYNWNHDSDGNGKRYFSSKAVLDTFYAKLKAKGKIDFQIAYHAYPEGLSDPVFWDDAKATSSSKAKIVNFKNLKTLTNYVKKNFGKDCKIMLSEQSFNSSKGEEIQAAAYAYAYYISEGNSMIEAFIYGRHVDHTSETSLGYHWGLYDAWYQKRLVWHVFQYIDSKESFTFTDPLISYTNIKKWNKIDGFKKAKYTKMASKLKKAAITNATSASTTSLTLSWNKIDTADGYEIYRNGVYLAEIANNETVSYTDKNLAKTGTYQYQVRMYKEAPKSGNAKKRVRIYGDLSDVFTATVTAGKASLDEDNCDVDGGEITVAWKKMAGADGYEIYRAPKASGSYALLGAVPASQISYRDTTAVTGETYVYKVRAYVVIGGINHYGDFSEETTRTARIQLTAGIENGKVVLNWTQWPQTDTYRVFYKRQAEPEDNYVRVGGIRELTYSMSQFKDAAGNLLDFVPNEVYSFRVRAVMPDGSVSKYSNVVELRIDESFGKEESTEEKPQEETEDPGALNPDAEDEEKQPGMTEPAPQYLEAGGAEE